jgi:hypothetical protein
MNNQFGPGEQTCLLNESAQCNRIWVSKADGLRQAHFQTLRLEPISKDSDAAVLRISAPAAYEQCARGGSVPGDP